MPFEYPPRTTFHVKEKISQVLWVLKLEGDIEDRQCAVRVLMKRLAAHGVKITAEQGFRLMLTQMSGGKYGDLILRDVNGRRTQAIVLVTEDMPPNYLPDADVELLDDDDELTAESAGDTFTRQSLFEPVAPVLTVAPAPVPVVERPAEIKPAAAAKPLVAVAPVRPLVNAAATASAARVDERFDLIAAELEQDLEELRRPMAAISRLTVRERVGRTRNLDDKAGVVNAILELVGDLAVMVAGEPTAHESDVALKERLADAVEQTGRFRQRALDAAEAAAAKEAEIKGLRRQLGDKEAMVARLEANVEALQNGERVADDRMVNAANRFLSARPHHRHGADKDSALVYSVGG